MIEPLKHQIRFAVVADAAFPHCEPARILAALLHDGMLPRFKWRYGRRSGDCHDIAQALIGDLYDAGPTGVRWYWYIGECLEIGEHSWIECEGWAIDASNGIKRHAIWIQRANDYRQMMRAINIAQAIEKPPPPGRDRGSKGK
jgi:hypothetical protein